MQLAGAASLAGTVTLLDVRGQVVETCVVTGGTTWSKPVANLARGLYFLRYQGTDGRGSCYKLVKE